MFVKIHSYFLEVCAPAIMRPGLKMRNSFGWGTRKPEVKIFNPKLIIIVFSNYLLISVNLL